MSSNLHVTSNHRWPWKVEEITLKCWALEGPVANLGDLDLLCWSVQWTGRQHPALEDLPNSPPNPSLLQKLRFSTHTGLGSGHAGSHRPFLEAVIARSAALFWARSFSLCILPWRWRTGTRRRQEEGERFWGGSFCRMECGMRKI